MSERLTDDQVAWYAGTSRTAKWTADMAVHENIVTLAREVQAHRSSHAHFTAETDEFGEWHLAIRIPHAPGRPDGRTSTTTFWTVTDQQLVDILDALTMIAAHTQTGATS